MILHGVDVHARYQKGLKASGLAGVDFVITKATGGTGLVIDGWLGMLDGAKLTGVYHYAREKGFQGSAKQEAEHFITQARKAPSDAMLILDWEEATNTDLGDTAWVLEWCQLVEKALGRRPVIYTGNQVLAQHPRWWEWSNAHGYYLWYARYPSSKPVGWQNYPLPTVPNWPDARIAMWQYSSAGGIPGWPAALDLNIFYGDAARWRAIAGSSKKEEEAMAWDGKMASPVVASRVSAEHRFNPTGSYPGHAGIDLVCPVGTAVHAAYAGVVELVGTNIVTGRTGKGILIRNPDGERQYYGHLSEIQVRQGQTVAMGEQIALSGATGNVTGPHLHWETWNAAWDDDRNPRVDFNEHGVAPGSSTGMIVAGALPATNAPTGKHAEDTRYKGKIDGVMLSMSVKSLQAWLTRRKYYVAGITGILDAETWKGVQRWLAKDGYYKGSGHGRSDTATVKALQKALQNAGYYTDYRADGDLGTQTVKAWQSYLAKHL